MEWLRERASVSIIAIFNPSAESTLRLRQVTLLENRKKQMFKKGIFKDQLYSWVFAVIWIPLTFAQGVLGEDLWDKKEKKITLCILAKKTDWKKRVL